MAEAKTTRAPAIAAPLPSPSISISPVRAVQLLDLQQAGRVWAFAPRSKMTMKSGADALGDYQSAERLTTAIARAAGSRPSRRNARMARPPWASICAASKASRSTS